MQNSYKKAAYIYNIQCYWVEFLQTSLIFCLENLYVHNYFVRLQNILELSLRNESVVNNKKPWKMQYALKHRIHV